MFVKGIGTAVPPSHYTQAECWEALRAAPEYAELTTRSRALLRKVLLGDNGIERRYLALDPLAEAFCLTPDAMHHRFLKHAPTLAAKAAERALRQAGVATQEIDALIISTCTGYLCPGLTSYVSERLGLRSDTLGLDLVGQGCGAALPNLRTAAALLAAGNCANALCVCVEVCSAAFYVDDDPGVLVSACLFGDGAAAVVVSGQPSGVGRRIAWRDAESLLSPADRDGLRFEQRNGMLRNILTRQVPALAARHAETVLSTALARAHVNRTELTGWILHAAGRDVLLALRERWGLANEDLRWSAAVLREHGNMSSASVLFVLAAALTAGAPGGWWWMSSFGAGFTCHGALWEVE